MIFLKSEKDISIMREGGKKLATIMGKLKLSSKPGVTTNYLEEMVRDLIAAEGAKPAFLGYEGYPAALCTSINQEIVHAIPSERVLENGDIFSLDLGIIWKGLNTDMSITFPIGEVSSEKGRIIKVTRKALKLAIKKARRGNTTGDIGNTIQRFVESQGFNIVKSLCGHGIGKELHEPPEILNFGKRHKGEKLEEGMVICIEPMVTEGRGEVKKGLDGFSYETVDGSMSCSFEHTVAITKNGTKVLTEI
jgi:methionyl aminopeptidase